MFCKRRIKLGLNTAANLAPAVANFEMGPANHPNIEQRPLSDGHQGPLSLFDPGPEAATLNLEALSAQPTSGGRTEMASSLPTALGS